VAHQEYVALDFEELIGKKRKVIVFDANNVLTDHQQAKLRALGVTTAGIGRGECR
jgi:hypothetical protein